MLCSNCFSFCWKKQSTYGEKSREKMKVDTLIFNTIFSSLSVMEIFRGSLAEDKVDRWNNRWAVILLLLLSLTTWLVMLQQPTTSKVISEDKKEQHHLRYSANCWCPVQFTEANVLYTNVVCGVAFNQAVNPNAKDDNETSNPVADVHLQNPDFTFGNADIAPEFIPIKKEQIIEKAGQNTSQTVIEVLKENHFIYINTPLILFVLALALKVPHILWSLLSGFAGIGVNKILESAKANQVLDATVKGQFKEDLVKTVRQSSVITSILYILFKIITLLVIVFGLFIIRYTLIPQVQTVDNAHYRVGYASTTSTIRDDKSVVGYGDDKSVVGYCSFDIRQTGNRHNYLVQCIFTLDTSSITPDPSASQSPGSYELEKDHLYEALFQILEVFFAVLALVNFTSIFIWILALAPGPIRKKVFSSNGLSTDVCLLLFMARQNVGLLVAKDLEESFAFDIGNYKKAGEELKELKD